MTRANAKTVGPLKVYNAQDLGDMKARGQLLDNGYKRSVVLAAADILAAADGVNLKEIDLVAQPIVRAEKAKGLRILGSFPSRSPKHAEGCPCYRCLEERRERAERAAEEAANAPKAWTYVDLVGGEPREVIWTPGTSSSEPAAKRPAPAKRFECIDLTRRSAKAR
jgi:hypothetical protein